MNIKSTIKKLRNAADALEELFTDVNNENERTARKIIKSVKRKKLHWTQTARGKRILSRNAKKLGFGKGNRK